MRSHLSKNCQQKAIFDIKEREPQTSNECFNQQTVIKISPLEKKTFKKIIGNLKIMFVCQVQRKYKKQKTILKYFFNKNLPQKAKPAS